MTISNQLLKKGSKTNWIYQFSKIPNDNGVVKYSAYWCLNWLNQGELYCNKAYRKLNVVECAKDSINSQT